MNFLRLRSLAVVAGLAGALVVPSAASAATTPDLSALTKAMQQAAAAQRQAAATQAAAARTAQAQELVAAADKMKQAATTQLVTQSIVNTLAIGVSGGVVAAGTMAQAQTQQKALEGDLSKLEAEKTKLATATQNAADMQKQLQSTIDSVRTTLAQIIQAQTTAMQSIMRG